MFHNNHRTASNNAMYTMYNSLMFWTYITRINEKLFVLIFLQVILVWQDTTAKVHSCIVVSKVKKSSQTIRCHFFIQRKFIIDVPDSWSSDNVSVTGLKVWVQILGRVNQSQCRQRLAATATFFERSCVARHNDVRIGPANSFSCFGVIQPIQKRFDNGRFEFFK